MYLAAINGYNTAVAMITAADARAVLAAVSGNIAAVDSYFTVCVAVVRFISAAYSGCI